MDVEQLVDDTVEQQLQTWLRKFPNAVEVLKHIEDLFAGQKIAVLADIGEHVSISGPVHIGKGSKIHPFVTIEGPVIIGEDVSIRSHSIIRDADLPALRQPLSNRSHDERRSLVRAGQPAAS